MFAVAMKSPVRAPSTGAEGAVGAERVEFERRCKC
jgi:hypothetical protein